MRDFIRLFINGVERDVRGRDIYKTLADMLRTDDGATGTKVVCAEGDCGACTVLMRRGGGFEAVNSCIQSMFQLDGASIVSVEGLCPKPSGDLQGTGEMPSSTGLAVQSSMVSSHGAQCGYCTPGFVVAMTALFEGQDRVTEQEARDGLTGNLCRCTGYEPILKAACAIDASSLLRMSELYPAMTDERSPVFIEVDGRRFFAPATIEEAVAFLHDNPGCTIVQGGTDVGVWINKRAYTTASMLCLTKIAALDSLEVAPDGSIVAGANVTLSAFERIIADRIPELHRILDLFGSPQIRNAATLVGNIANGSPIADTLPYLFVAGATLTLVGPSGRREIPIESFYRGYKKFDLAPDELIASVRVPCVRTTPTRATGARSDRHPEEVLKLYKVSRRKDLDISAFTAAIRLGTAAGAITSATIAYGGVGPVVLRLPNTEAFLQGKTIGLATFREAGLLARSEIAPISDVRGSRDYRLQLAENILCKFYFDAFGPRAAQSASEPFTPHRPRHPEREGSPRRVHNVGGSR